MARNRQIWNRRGLTQLQPPSARPVDTRGVPVVGMRRINLADFAVANGGSGVQDPNSRLASAITDGGEGIGFSISLTGGLAAITDPFSGVYATMPLSSLFATKLAGSGLMWSLWLQAIERTSASGTSDLNWALGVCNESVDSGTIEAVCCGTRYTASNRQQITARVMNGTATTSAVTQTGMRGILTCISKIGTNPSVYNQPLWPAVDAALSLQSSGSPTNSTSVSLSPGDGDPSIFFAAWRSATTAGNGDVAIDLYAGCGVTLKAAT